jgi:hypothetical protein
MPLMHCTECAHEWESCEVINHCDWCGKPGKVISDKTDLERMFDRIGDNDG